MSSPAGETKPAGAIVPPPPPEYYQETNESKFWRKCKENPFVPLGFVGFTGSIAYAVYHYKNRGSQSTSMYIMRFRVIAQAMVVGSMTIGMGITLGQKLYDQYWPGDSSVASRKS